MFMRYHVEAPLPAAAVEEALGAVVALSQSGSAARMPP
jgi:hypothetical protein